MPIPTRRLVALGAAAVAFALALWGGLAYLHWQRDRAEAAVLARAVRYAVEQFSPAYLDYVRRHRQEPRDNMDLRLAPPRDPLWVGLSRAQLFPNGDIHFEYEVPGGQRHPLLVWHIDVRDPPLSGDNLCGARDIPARLLAWNGLECGADVAEPAADAPNRVLRSLALPVRATSEVDDVFDAVGRDDPELLAQLKADGRDLCAASPENLIALGQAARGNQTRVVPVLAAACGVDQVEPAGGRTALMIAVAAHSADATGALLAAGADPLRKATDGAEAWFELGTGADPLSLSIRGMLVAKGVPVDTRAPDGATLLMRAADEGDTELAAWLRQLGAQLDLQDASGRTALMHAAVSGRELMLRFLVSQKARLDLRDAEGRTALDLARALPESPRRSLMIRILGGQPG